MLVLISLSNLTHCILMDKHIPDIGNKQEHTKNCPGHISSTKHAIFAGIVRPGKSRPYQQTLGAKC